MCKFWKNDDGVLLLTRWCLIKNSFVHLYLRSPPLKAHLSLHIVSVVRKSHSLHKFLAYLVVFSRCGDLNIACLKSHLWPLNLASAALLVPSGIIFANVSETSIQTDKKPTYDQISRKKAYRVFSVLVTFINGVVSGRRWRPTWPTRARSPSLRPPRAPLGGKRRPRRSLRKNLRRNRTTRWASVSSTIEEVRAGKVVWPLAATLDATAPGARRALWWRHSAGNHAFHCAVHVSANKSRTTHLQLFVSVFASVALIRGYASTTKGCKSGP